MPADQGGQEVPKEAPIALTTTQIKQLIREEISRLVKLVDSDSIEVAVGDHPLQPSIKTSAGGGLTWSSTIRLEEALIMDGLDSGNVIGSGLEIDSSIGAVTLLPASIGNDLKIVGKPAVSAPQISDVHLEGSTSTSGGLPGGDAYLTGGPNLVGGDRGDVHITGKRINLVGFVVGLGADSVSFDVITENTPGFQTSFPDGLLVNTIDELDSGGLVLQGDVTIDTDQTITLGGGDGAFTIKKADRSTSGAGTPMTLVGSAASGVNQVGGGFTLQLGAPTGVGAEGRFLIEASDGVNWLEIDEVSGAVFGVGIDLAGNTLDMGGGDITAVDDILGTDGMIFGITPENDLLLFDGSNNRIIAKTNNVERMAIEDAQILLAVDLDLGNNDLQNVGKSGTRIASYSFNFSLANSGSALMLLPTDAISGDVNSQSFFMVAAGSLRAVTGYMDINVYTSGDIDVDVRKIGTGTLVEETTGFNSVGNGQTFEYYYPSGTHTFLSGERLQVRRDLTGTATTDDLMVTLTVEYDTDPQT